jgi:hypothetical protein
MGNGERMIYPAFLPQPVVVCIDMPELSVERCFLIGQ